MSQHYLVKLEMFITHVLPSSCYRNSRIYPTSTVVSKFAIFQSSWLQRVRTIARKGAQNTRHWSGHMGILSNWSNKNADCITW